MTILTEWRLNSDKYNETRDTNCFPVFNRSVSCLQFTQTYYTPQKTPRQNLNSGDWWLRPAPKFIWRWVGGAASLANQRLGGNSKMYRSLRAHAAGWMTQLHQLSCITNQLSERGNLRAFGVRTPNICSPSINTWMDCKKYSILWFRFVLLTCKRKQ